MNSNITFQRETFATFLEDLKPVLPLHYEELALNKDDVPLDPDWDSYLDLEARGMFHIFTARDSDGTLVGYICGFIKTHMHYRTTLHYCNDLYYVKQEYRNNGIGYKFFKAHEKDLVALGVVKSVMATKLHQSHVKLFDALMYRVSDTVMVKVL